LPHTTLAGVAHSGASALVSAGFSGGISPRSPSKIEQLHAVSRATRSTGVAQAPHDPPSRDDTATRFLYEHYLIQEI